MTTTGYSAIHAKRKATRASKTPPQASTTRMNDHRDGSVVSATEIDRQEEDIDVQVVEHISICWTKIGREAEATGFQAMRRRHGGFGRRNGERSSWARPHRRHPKRDVYTTTATRPCSDDIDVSTTRKARDSCARRIFLKSVMGQAAKRHLAVQGISLLPPSLHLLEDIGRRQRHRYDG